jgi:hypothetical protein
MKIVNVEMLGRSCEAPSEKSADCIECKMTFILSSKLRFYRFAPSEYYVTFDFDGITCPFPGSGRRAPGAVGA